MSFSSILDFSNRFDFSRSSTFRPLFMLDFSSVLRFSSRFDFSRN
nr:MAG TPA: hypothetical protein [Caudoviricetes sp.]